MRRVWGALVAVAVLATACEPMGPAEASWREETPPPAWSKVREEEELTFARYARGVGPSVAEVPFVAVVGETSTLLVRYAGLPVVEQPVLLEFEVGPQSLLTDADGNPVVPGQEVVITVRLDPERFIFYFVASGVTFSSESPALLRLSYEGADPNVDGDGDVDQRDRVLENRFRIWQQEVAGGPWRKLPTDKLEGDVIQARILHFTGFAMAD